MPRLFKRLVPFLLLFCFYVGFYTLVSHLIFAVIGSKEQEIPAYNWVKAVYHYGKRQQMFAFLGNGVVFFGLLLVLYFLFSYPRFRERVFSFFESLSPLRTVILLVTSLAFNAVFYKVFSVHNGTVIAWPMTSFILDVMIYAAGCWFILRVLTVAEYKNPYELDQLMAAIRRGSVTLKILGGIAIVLVGILYARIYQPFFDGQLPFMNEYLNLSSTITVDDNRYDTLEKLNSIPSLGLHIEDYRNFDMKVERPILRGEEGHLLWLADEFPAQLLFDDYLKALIAIAPLKGELEQYLRQDSQLDQDELEKFVAVTEERERKKQLANSRGERKFIEAFSQAFQIQIYSRWYIHHHNFVFGPVNKVDLGYDLSKVFFQYGVTGGVIQAFAAKNIFGSFNLENYFRTWVIFFVAYFALFVIAVYFMTKKMDLTFLAAALLLILLYSQTYEHIFLGPGLNPLRHFFDVLVFLCLGQYFKNETRPRMFLLALMCFLNFCLNPEFGLFCYFSILVALSFFCVSKKRLLAISDLLILAGFAVLHAVGWVLLRQGTEGVVSLYMGGFFSPVISFKLILAGFLSLFILVVGVLYNKDSFDSNKLSLWIGSLAYAVVILSYCLWGTTWNHIVNVSSILIFSLMLFLDLVFSPPQPSRLLVRVGLVAAMFPLMLTGHHAFVDSQGEYMRLLGKFENQRWSIEGAKILTAIPEKPFQESLTLIEKYRQGPGITIFSKFDNLLNILSRTYSKLPTNEVMSFMMSPAEKIKLKQTFRADKPELVFTDVDILAPAVDELVDPNIYTMGPLFQESAMRLARINNLKSLFAELSGDYELVESAGLLSVWRRK